MVRRSTQAKCHFSENILMFRNTVVNHPWHHRLLWHPSVLRHCPNQYTMSDWLLLMCPIQHTMFDWLFSIFSVQHTMFDWLFTMCPKQHALCHWLFSIYPKQHTKCAALLSFSRSILMTSDKMFVYSMIFTTGPCESKLVIFVIVISTVALL